MKTIAVLAGVLILSGCGNAGGVNNISPHTVKLNDGNKVECVMFDGYQNGGIWCQESGGIQPYPAERQR